VFAVVCLKQSTGAITTAKTLTTANAIVNQATCALANVLKDLPEFNVE